jgi:uncharacterized phage protein (TIGR01671 family)
MSDRYKFRGKRKDNGQWSKGSLVVWGNARYIVAIVIPKGQEVYFVPDFPSGKPLIEVDPATVGQFTGLADKNSKEIYFGDKIRLESEIKDEFLRFEGWHIGQKNYESFLSLFNPEETDSIPLFSFDYTASKEIIGSIHDNPELLKQAQKP